MFRIVVHLSDLVTAEFSVKTFVRSEFQGLEITGDS